jgi:hypothetical protein
MERYPVFIRLCSKKDPKEIESVKNGSHVDFNTPS